VGSEETSRIRVSPQVARIVGPEAARDLKLSAARGALPLSGVDLVTVLLVFGRGADVELRALARKTLRELPVSLLSPVVTDSSVSPALLLYVARERLADQSLVERLLQNPATPDDVYLLCARQCDGPILSMIASNSARMQRLPALATAIIANPHADRALKYRLGWLDPDDSPKADEAESSAEVAAEEPVIDVGDDGDEEDEERRLSKYQKSLEIGVSEKIKIAMTGDKEWRSILLRDANKLVSSGVLKNPRITIGEVVSVAKNKTANDELIRIILLNKEWLKTYEMRRALALHPRTPLNKALRFMSMFGEKDLKAVASSKDISAVLVNNARRMLLAKANKK
jgi:hypothetical protein